ncbi:peptidoglycan-binding protein [Jannaschia sp. S6380]|uniref:peptidoglycan-binding domain-containing protein n=1 Tax=Jannaschia sp. S6380 TaxID=2926408 RepID=UPI001FF47E47|nr:peptidoglycan-binding domain-containing protein [Jannaschia sp. S6380]MCK0167772.1 peptidoglycan-binding protein [Jannaschia sp. S6380]
MILRTLALVGMLAACSGLPAETAATATGPAGAPPGTCHARGITPAILETVTEQRQEAPASRAPDGTVLEPARFRTVTSTRILRPRSEDWFETPCALRANDAGFIAQVQRALAARDLYDGEITGVYDGRTRIAVRRYQTPRGLESGTLSLASAKALGLVALGRDGV